MNFVKKLSATFMTLLLVVGVPSLAFAEGGGDAGGDGGLPGAGVVAKTLYWVGASGSYEGEAYQKILSTIVNVSYAESQMGGRIDCQKADKIWVSMVNERSGRFMTQMSNTVVWGGHNPQNTSYGIQMSEQNREELEGYIKKSIPGETRAYTFYCLWEKNKVNNGCEGWGEYKGKGPLPGGLYAKGDAKCLPPTPPPGNGDPTPAGGDSELEQCVRDTSRDHSVNSVRKKTVTIESNHGDHVKSHNLHTQTATIMDPTAYGEVLNSVLSGAHNKSTWTRDSYGSLKNQTSNAIEATKNQHPSTDLDEQNKRGLAEGGVLDVVERSADGGWTYTYCRHETRKRKYKDVEVCTGAGKNKTCTNVSAFDGWTPWAPTGNYYAWNRDFNAYKSYNDYISGFWQMLNVHCNKAGFESQVLGAGGEDTSTDPSHEASATAKTPFMNSRTDMFSIGRNADFFTKECPYDCTSNPNTPQAETNGANKNINNTDYDIEGPKYGAVSDGKNSSAFTYFRDNVPQRIRTDLWYPVTTGIVRYDGEPAITSTFTKWDQGTPSANVNGFTKFIANGNLMFQGSSSPGNQYNDDRSTPNTGTSTILAGQHTDFTAQSSWASDAITPHKLNFKWEYEPYVTSNYYTTLTGAPQRHQGVGGSQDRVQGKCYAQFNTLSYPKNELVNLFQTNTGQNSRNILDTNVRGGNYDMIIRFVRATSE